MRLIRNKNIVGYAKSLITGYGQLLVTIVVQIALIPIIVRNIGINNFGQYSVLYNLVSFSAIGITWVTGGGVRLVGEYAAQGRWKLINSFYTMSKVIFLLYSVFLSVLLVVILFIFKKHFNTQTITSVVYFCIYLFFHFNFCSEQIILSAILKQDISNILSLIFQLVNFSSVIIVLPHNKQVHILFLCMIFSMFLVQILSWGYWYYSKDVTIRFRFVRREFREVFNHLWKGRAKKYSLYGFCVLFSQADVALIGFLCGSEIAGLFAILWKIPNLLIQLFGRIPGYLEPYIIQLDAVGNKEVLERLFKKGFALFLILVLIMSICYIALGRFILELWLGIEYVAFNNETYILSGGAIFCLSLSRWPVTFLYSLVEFTILNRLIMLEVVLKYVFIALFFNKKQHLAPIYAINLEFWLIMGFAYIKYSSSFLTKEKL